MNISICWPTSYNATWYSWFLLYYSQICHLCSSSYKLIWLADKHLRCGFMRELSFMMNGYGTFFGTRRTTFMWKVWLAHTIPVFWAATNLHQFLQFLQTHITFNCLVRFYCYILCGCVLFVQRPQLRWACDMHHDRSLMRFNIRTIRYFGSSGKVMWTTVFMQDGANVRYVKQLLRRHFGQDRIISRQFPTTWPPTSLDLNVCGFWL